MDLRYLSLRQFFAEDSGFFFWAMFARWQDYLDYLHICRDAGDICPWSSGGER